MASNPEVYPVTAAFEKFAAEQTAGLDPTHGLCRLSAIISEVIGEYEHGTADPETVFEEVSGLDLSGTGDDRERRRTCLELYAAVCRDVVLSVRHWE